MKNTLMTSLLKAKSDANKEVEALIEEYLSTVKRKNKAETEAFVSDLLVYVMQNVESIDKEVLLDIVSAKVKSLGYTLDTAILETLHEKSAAAVASSVGATFTFDKTDAQVLDSMQRALTWMKEDGAANTQDKLKTIIGQAMEGEINMSDLGETLREGFEGVVDESARYFEGVSDHVIRQSQSVTRAYQFEKAGIKEVKVVAVIDNRTSIICKSLHGRIISVKKAVGQADAITEAQSIEEKKSASRWQTQPIFGTLGKDVALPPYHFRCRTIVVAYFPQSVEVDGKNVNGSLLPGETYKGKEVLFSHVDSLGYERIVTEGTINHESDSVKPPLRKIKAALEDIADISTHVDPKSGQERIQTYSKVVGSKTGMYISYYPDGEVVTAFRRDRDYFTERVFNGHEVIQKSKEDMNE